MKNCIQPKSHQKGHGKLAVITGADGGMGMEITRYVALAGFRVISLLYTSPSPRDSKKYRKTTKA